MKISEVKRIQGNGTWDSSHGLMYKFEVEMTDGTVLNVNAKSQTPPYKEGDKVEYQVTKETQYGKQGKVKKYDPEAPTKSYGGGQQNPKNYDEIGRLACVKAAAEFHAQSTTKVSKVIATAEAFFQYAKNGTLMDGVKPSENEDDLPF